VQTNITAIKKKYLRSPNQNIKVGIIGIAGKWMRIESAKEIKLQ